MSNLGKYSLVSCSSSSLSFSNSSSDVLSSILYTRGEECSKGLGVLKGLVRGLRYVFSDCRALTLLLEVYEKLKRLKRQLDIVV